MSETRKYFEHITGKSERVLPTEPGWWWARLHGADQVFRVKRDEVGWLHFGTEIDVRWECVEWLEPVAPLGTAARLAAAEAELAELKVTHATAVKTAIELIGMSCEKHTAECLSMGLSEYLEATSAMRCHRCEHEELAELKQRIAAVLECVAGSSSAVGAYGCKSERDELATLRRLLEVRDGE